MKKTACNITVKNLLDKKITIAYVHDDKVDWMDGPETVMDGQSIEANDYRNFELNSKDDYSRCWFEYKAKYDDERDLFIGMTHIELKTDDTGRQQKKEERTEYYDHPDLRVKVNIHVKTSYPNDNDMPKNEIEIIYSKM